MAETLNVILSSGRLCRIDLDEGETPAAVLAEITNREHDYEWTATQEGTYIRVEAIDEIWIGELPDADEPPPRRPEGVST